MDRPRGGLQWGFPIAALMVGVSTASAHPGDLDPLGCHVGENGQKHCHGTGDQGSGLVYVATAEIGVEGGFQHRADRNDASALATVRVHSNGSLLLLATVGLAHRLGSSRVSAYADIGLGAVSLVKSWEFHRQWFIAVRGAAGLRFRLMDLGSPDRQAYLKVGAFLESFSDEDRYGPWGLDLTLSFAL